MTDTLVASVREIRREIRIDLTDAPTLTNLIGQTRKPHGLRLAYGIRRDIARVDIVIEWQDSAEYWPPAAEMPDWLRNIVSSYQPRDVDDPDDFRPAGLGGWPLAARRRLTENEHSAAWHAIEGTAAEEGADPGTVLNAVLRALNIDPPETRPTP